LTGNGVVLLTKEDNHNTNFKGTQPGAQWSYDDYLPNLFINIENLI